MVLTQIKYIKPKKLNIAGVRLEILNELRRQGKEVVKEMEKPLATWRDAPKIDFEIGLDREAAILLVGPIGSEDQVNKFIWLDEGTRIRWALMSKDWKSKTKPRSFKSGSGKGKVLIAGKRAMSKRGIGPRPGIKAREWTKTLAKRRRKIFTNAIIKAKNSGEKKLYK